MEFIILLKYNIMPKRIEYLKEDGTIGYFNDWTKEWNEAQEDETREILNDPEKIKVLKERFRRFEEATRKKAEGLKKHKNKNHQ